MSKIVFGVAFILPFGKGSMKVWPVGMTAEAMFTKAMEMGFPSVSIVIPYTLLPFAAALTPKAPSPFSSEAFPIAFASFAYYYKTSSFALLAMVYQLLVLCFGPTSSSEVFEVSSAFYLSASVSALFYGANGESFRCDVAGSLFFSV